MRVKRSRNVKYLFFKTNAETNGKFHMQIMLIGGKKHERIICDHTGSKKTGTKTATYIFT